MKWTPRDTAQQLQRLTRHTSIVLVSKFSLVGLAALLILMVFLVPVLHEDDTGARLVFTNVESGEFITPRMSKPRLRGVDKNNRPYTILAEMAERQDNGQVLLTRIEADITLASGTWIALLADQGMLDTEANTLLLSGNVQMFHDEGYDMRTNSVLLSLDSSEAVGNERIEGQGPMGTLSASGFKVLSDQQHIVFSPDVKVKLIPKRGA